MTVMLHNRQSSFMDQIQPVYRAGVLTKWAWKRTGCLMDLCLALLHLEILSLCCRQRCYFRLPGFSSTIWTEHFVLKPLWEVTNRRMELPVCFKYYMQTKTRYQVIYPSHELYPLPGLAYASCWILSRRDTATSQAAAACSNLSGRSRATVLALCLCYHRGGEPRVGRRTSWCSTCAGIS